MRTLRRAPDQREQLARGTRIRIVLTWMRHSARAFHVCAELPVRVAFRNRSQQHDELRHHGHEAA